MDSSFSDDPFFLSALMDFDSFSEQFLASELGAHKVFATLSQPNNPSTPNTDTNSDQNSLQCNNTIIPRPLLNISLPEKMLRVLSLFKQSSCTGILAQVWTPIKQGDNYILTTTDQPFLLDQILADYREISRQFIFSAKEGLPGRVFISGLPEWTSNVVYYKDPEYLRKPYAIDNQVRGSLALPVFDPFDPGEASCVAVLELVTNREKKDFDAEMDSVCNALQTVNLSTTKTHSFQQTLTKNKKTAFSEILDVLRTICHAHMLPLALTWIPITGNPNPSSKTGNQIPTALKVHAPACYMTDATMDRFLHACAEHQLGIGQGIVGKALESNIPFFSDDVREYSIRDYPLAHHARKFGLRAAVAIRLRSNYTGNEDYFLELFLPVNCTGSEEQQVLLNNLSCTLQRVCKSLRTVSDEELGLGLGFGGEMDFDGGEITKMPFGDRGVMGDEAGDVANDKGKKNGEKKRNTAEKNISLSVLQKYFSGSLKDAAKSLGVCPTTLKRICRQNGISRWPSRKINKVNRSLKKIQNVINSVQGVEGGAFKYDPASGCIVTGSEPDNPLTNPRTNPRTSPKIEQEDQQIHFQNSNLNLSNLSSSSTTDSSSGSANSHRTFTKKPNLTRTSTGTDTSTGTGTDTSQFITIKASYKGDTVRFKLFQNWGYDKLFEEIRKRFRLLEGSFQIKYRDDEEEWVNLSNDLDLRECVDVMDSIGSKTVKLLVKEVASSGFVSGFVGGGSSSSSCLLMEN